MNRDLLVPPDLTLLQAMDALTKGNARIVFVVDERDTLLGTLTDGDIRRFILAGHELSGSIRDAYNRNPITVRSDALSMPELRGLFQEKAIDVIPVVDDERRIVDYVTWHDAFEEHAAGSGDIDGVPVVIMAGGQGTRLAPFTHVLPKPLIPIDGRPVIEHIMDRFIAAGARKFYLTVNHKARILRAYLEDANGARQIEYVEEDRPLGTAGALRLLAGRFTKPILVTNCDVLVAVDYRELLDFHEASGCALTLVASARTFRLPYGACAINADGTLRGIEEKPELARLVNTGLYVVNANAIDRIPAGQVYNMTTLMADLMSAGQRVAVYPVSSEAWIDVGQWEEYRRAAHQLGRGASTEDLI